MSRKLDAKMHPTNGPKTFKNGSENDPESIKHASEIDAKMMMDLRWHFGGILGVLGAILGPKKWDDGIWVANNGPTAGRANPTGEG